MMASQQELAAQNNEVDELEKAPFPEMDQDQKKRKKENLNDMDFILDIPLINELLQLGQGSVIELNKLAGEPLEIFINRKLVARGEAVVVNEKFGVRLTDIISPMERVKQLG
jgi:flagellar motor switch protein FliN/FliY